MRVVVFDLDQTLADISSVYFFIGSLTMKSYRMEYYPYMINFFNKELHDSLDDAYLHFVSLVLEAERSDHPLGILRPGILGIMKQLYEGKQARRLDHVLIYSNNGMLSNLHFVRDVIHAYLGHPLIVDCIHWNHPLRKNDKHNRFMVKSWATLQQIIQEGPCQAYGIEPCDVLFFDDVEHINLQVALGKNYHHVPAYHMDAFVRTSLLYQCALQRVNLSTLYHTFSNVFDVSLPQIPPDITLETWIALLRSLTPLVENSAPDTGIQLMHHVIQE